MTIKETTFSKPIAPDAPLRRHTNFHPEVYPGIVAFLDSWISTTSTITPDVGRLSARMFGLSTAMFHGLGFSTHG